MKDRTSNVTASAVLADGDWPQAAHPQRLLNAVVGTIVGLVDDVLLVTYPGQLGSDAVQCRTVVDLPPDAVGRQALLMFDGGDPRRPILIGCVKETVQPLSARPATVEVEADQKRVVVTAKEQIVLQCGAASITLTKAGKLIMRGEYISQRSTGVVRIKGGCVEIN